MFKIYRSVLVSLCLIVSISVLGQSSKTDNSPELTAKFGKGVKLVAADSSFDAKLNFRIQSLASYSTRLDDPSKAPQTAMMIRRATYQSRWLHGQP